MAWSLFLPRPKACALARRIEAESRDAPKRLQSLIGAAHGLTISPVYKFDWSRINAMVEPSPRLFHTSETLARSSPVVWLSKLRGLHQGYDEIPCFPSVAASLSASLI